MSVEAFFKQRAVNITVAGRYSLANWYDPEGKPREFACRTSRVSPFQMLLAVPVTGKRGERVSAYFSDFGHLEGLITDVVNGGLLLELAIERKRRQQLANKLEWLEKRQQDTSVRDARKEKRIMPAEPHATLVFHDGSTRGCFVIDISTSGVAVSADLVPEIGTPLAVGACVGRVVRHFREGFAVKFVELQNANRLEALIAKPIAGPAESRPPAASAKTPARRAARAGATIPNEVVFV
jgi:PilZ domain